MKFIVSIAVVCLFSSCNLLGQNSRPNEGSNNGTNGTNNGTSDTNNKTVSTNNKTTETTGTTSTTTATTGTTSGTTAATFDIPFSRLLTTTRSREGLIAQWNFDDFEDKVGDLLLHVHSSASLFLPHGVDLTGGFLDLVNGGEPTQALRATNAFTIELWIEPKAVQDYDAVLFSLEEDSGPIVRLSQQEDTAVLAVRTHDRDHHPDGVKGKEALRVPGVLGSQLSHFLMTYDGANIELWVDGVKRGSSPLPGGLDSDSTPQLRFGSAPDSREWEGLMFYAAIYDRTLRPEEIRHHFSLGEGINPEIIVDVNSVEIESGQAWPFDLLTEADFALFAEAGCTEVEGTVKIPISFLNLSQLASLEIIRGDLIVDDTILRTLSGLEALNEVGGRVEIVNNSVLNDVNGLGNLTTLGSDLSIGNNSLLEAFELPKIKNVPGNFTLKNSPALTSADGLSELVSVGGVFVLDRLPSLTTISLDGLRTVKRLSFSRIPLTEINLPELASTDELFLRELPMFTTFSSLIAPPNVHIVGNASLVNLEDFSGTSETSIYVAHNSGLSRLSIDTTELNRLVVVENNLSVLDLPTLMTISEEFIFTSSQISNLDGTLPELTVAGEVNLWNNDALLSLNGAFPKLTTLGTLTMNSNELLPLISNAFPVLETLNGADIGGNPALAQCDVDLFIARITNTSSITTYDNTGVDPCL